MALYTRKTIVIGAASVALAAAGILPFYALAAPDSNTAHPSAIHRRLGIERLGTVSSVSDSSITLTTKKGLVYTVNIQDAKIVKEGVAASFAAVSVGDPIAVIGPAQGDAIDAHTVLDGQSTRLGRRGGIIGGTVTTVSSGEFTLIPKSHPGHPVRPPVLVNITADTIVTRAGQKVSLGTLSTGSEAIVSGTHEQNGTFVASKIIVRKR